ncbi:hypothetical protein AGOR_G00080380 [Albula goreensis]|uniref:Uncharacterized protein n=1 Tax=Albula goreensis TaxID=1534307 RepID=A0A8T3DMT5_9TELE|nr:hypothetical protein AGOR_G00080380 [Albula goreensis]
MAMVNHRQITEEFRNGILPPLKKGLAAISSLTNAINGINPNSIRESECEKILRLISTANRETQRATETAHQKLQNLNDKCERLIKEQKTLKDKMKSKEDDLQKRKTQTEQLEEEKEKRDRDLSRNQSELAEANENKRKAQKDYEDAETAAIVSAAVMFIPIVGTIAGGISCAVSLSYCIAAEKRCRELEDMAAEYRIIISDIEEKLRNKMSFAADCY